MQDTHVAFDNLVDRHRGHQGDESYHDSRNELRREKRCRHISFANFLWLPVLLSTDLKQQTEGTAAKEQKSLGCRSVAMLCPQRNYRAPRPVCTRLENPNQQNFLFDSIRCQDAGQAQQLFVSSSLDESRERSEIFLHPALGCQPAAKRSTNLLTLTI